MAVPQVRIMNTEICDVAMVGDGAVKRTRAPPKFVTVGLADPVPWSAAALARIFERNNKCVFRGEYDGLGNCLLEDGSPEADALVDK